MNDDINGKNDDDIVSKVDETVHISAENQDNRRLKDIPVRMNKLPWEREVDEYDDSEEKNSTIGSDSFVAPYSQNRKEGAADHNIINTDAQNPYTVGTRTYANPSTAIQSAASDKLFAMELDEYEEDRSRIRVFFDVLLGKIWKLMSLNFLTSIFNLPALLFMGFFSIYYMQLIQPTAITTAEEGGALAYLLIGYLPLALVFLAIPIVAFGPAQAGMHYILRNYSYEEPVFLWADFKEKMRENIKQGLAVSFINLLVFVLALLDIYMYPRMLAQTGSWILAANYLLILAFVVYLMLAMYIYPMMIRYELTLKNLYRNAFLMAVGRFLPNLLLLIIVVALSYGPFLLVSLFNNYIAYFIAYVYQIILGLTLPGLIISFLLNPAMDKVMSPKNENVETDSPS